MQLHAYCILEELIFAIVIQFVVSSTCIYTIRDYSTGTPQVRIVNTYCNISW